MRDRPETNKEASLLSMGLLRSVKTTDWEMLLKEKEKIKLNGISQFARMYRKYRHTTTGSYWGDEMEFMICTKRDRYYLVLCNEYLFTQNIFSNQALSIEYARYMLEIMPEAPFEMTLESLLNFERSLENRRTQLWTQLDQAVFGSFPLFMSSFPNLKDCYLSVNATDGDYGVDDAAGKRLQDDATMSLTYNITQSTVFPDNAISRHCRFISFTKNVIKRRGKPVEGYVRIMKDINTQDTGNKEKDAILIDSMGQGMGCCSLQVTIQYQDLDQARLQYDTLGVLAPLMLRMSRSTAVANGYLLNTETRWNIVGFSVDCRTSSERMCEYEKSGYEMDCKEECSRHIRKSRFSSIDMFIAQNKMNRSEYNDVYVPNIANFVETLVSHGVDFLMSKHIGSMFVRDPLLTYEPPAQNSDRQTHDYTDDFENIQTTNWRSVRLKVPSGSENRYNGWKVEFRTMEIQPTSFENAAFVIFVILLSRASIHYGFNLYIPMSLVEHNFVQASRLNRTPDDFHSDLQPDSVLFYYRTNIYDSGPPQISKGTLNDIFNGNESYEGLLSVVWRYVDEVFMTKGLDRYLDFIAQKCSGKYIAVSEYVRKFIMNHSMYKRDSVVHREIIDDLISHIKDIEEKNDPSYLAAS